jgi:methylglutaconyl-CoA hydratase
MNKTVILNLDARGDGSGVVALTINRPEHHNAFDGRLISELLEALDQVENNPDARVLILNAEGKTFSAGADLNWMRRMAELSDKENKSDTIKLAALMQKLNYLRIPTIAQVQGAAYGGGVGLVACCDMAIATTKAAFCLSEVRFGLIPAIISPYVIAAIGQSAARRYFITAEHFDAVQALQLGLIHEVVKDKDMTPFVDSLINNILQGGPKAQIEAKKLIFAVSAKAITDVVIGDTAKRISSVRSSAEARERINAFLQKRSAIQKKD